MSYIKLFSSVYLLPCILWSQDLDGLIYCNSMYDAPRYWLLDQDHSIAYFISSDQSYIGLFSRSPSPVDSVSVGNRTSDFLQSLNILSDSTFSVTTTNEVKHFTIRNDQLVSGNVFRTDQKGLPCYMDDELSITIPGVGGGKGFSPSYHIRIAGHMVEVPKSAKISKGYQGLGFPIQRVFVDKERSIIVIPQSLAGVVWLIDYSGEEPIKKRLSLPIATKSKQSWEFYYDRISKNVYALRYDKQNDNKLLRFDISKWKFNNSWHISNDVIEVHDHKLYFTKKSQDTVSKKKMTCHYLYPIEGLSNEIYMLDEVNVY